MSEKLIVYIDMDDVLCDYSTSHAKALQENPAIKYPQSQYGFFRNLEPIAGALEGAHYLAKQLAFDVYILTAPSYKNPLCYSEKREWVGRHLGIYFVKRLIISPNKGLNKGDYLIDDNTSGKGQEGFEGELIHFGSNDFPDWERVVKYLYLRTDL